MYENRMSICKECDRVKSYSNSIYQCLECLCILNIKARIKSQKCPLGKWNAENNDISNEECGGCS